MIYFMSLLAYGDNLISLSLLAKLKDKKNVTIVGTNLTREIAPFVPNLDIPIIVAYKKIPTFYNIRKCGVVSALKDVIWFLKNITKCTSKEDTLVFEKRDCRNRLLSGSISQRIYEPERKDNVYVDRRNLLEAVWGVRVSLKEAVKLRNTPRCVTINPASRLKEKAISNRVLGYLVSYLRANCINVQLIDPDQEHSNLQHLVDYYHTRSSLDHAVKWLRDCDLYIGADSLLIHFAYQYDVPFLILFNKTNSYFTPPGVENKISYIEFVSRLSEKEFCYTLETSLISLLKQ